MTWRWMLLQIVATLVLICWFWLNIGFSTMKFEFVFKYLIILMNFHFDGKQLWIHAVSTALFLVVEWNWFQNVFHLRAFKALTKAFNSLVVKPRYLISSRFLRVCEIVSLIKTFFYVKLKYQLGEASWWIFSILNYPNYFQFTADHSIKINEKKQNVRNS